MPTLVSAAPESCMVSPRMPSDWVVISGNTFISPDKSSTLTIECSILHKKMNDIEFAAYIGEEEPEEAPALSKFGAFRGRIWIVNLKDLEWWLMKDTFMVHLTLKSNNGRVSEEIEKRVNEYVNSLGVKKP